MSPAAGLTDPHLCLAPVCEPDSVLSVSFTEGRERSRRPSLSGRGLHLVAVGHFAHFGARFPVFRDRQAVSLSSGSLNPLRLL